MTRPETIEDLDSYNREPHSFIQVDPQHLTVDVTVGAALLNLIAAAQASDALEVSEDGEFKVTLPLTDEEIATRITNAQRSWDYNETDYEKVCSGEKVEIWRRPSIDRWAEIEGKDSIDWGEYEDYRAKVEA